MKRLRLLVWGAVLLGLIAWGAWRWWRWRGLSAVQRGYDLAQAHGCFGCHSPGGLAGFSDTTAAAVGDVPPFGRDELESYAKTEDEIREWILDGRPRRLAAEVGGEEPAPLLRMPAYRAVLGPRETADLVAYVKAVSGFHTPTEGPVAEGRELAQRWGCFTCHGPEGRGALPNPRSLKGYIPPWDGNDFTELVRNESELREWILDGSPRRLREHPLARRVLERQLVKMPAYRGRLPDADVERLVRYIATLRTQATAPAAGH